VVNFVIVFLQVATQLTLLLTVPIFFQATTAASSALAGAYLTPAFAGNLSGGILSGIWIKRTGRYKAATVLAPSCALTGLVLMLLFWNENTSPAECSFLFLGGFATAVVSSSAFVGLTVSVRDEDIAVAASGMYLFMNIGAITGVSLGSAVFQATLRTVLTDSLQGFENSGEVCSMFIYPRQESSDGILRLSTMRWQISNTSKKPQRISSLS
jgi:MFS family permease